MGKDVNGRQMLCEYGSDHAGHSKGCHFGIDESAVRLEEKLCLNNSQLEQLERENSRIVTQLKDVIKMNNHWQRYDAQREAFVLQLTRKNKEFQHKISGLQRQREEFGVDRTEMLKENQGSEATTLQRIRHGSADDMTRKISPTSSSCSSPSKEEETGALTNHADTVKNENLEMESRSEPKRNEDDDELNMLREQINICVEDFQQERRDRERIHAENERLRERLARSEQCLMKNEEQMFVYQEQIKRLQERCQLRSTSNAVIMKKTKEGCFYTKDRPHQKREHSPFGARNTFRHPIHIGDDLTDLPSDVEVDGVPDEPQDEADAGIAPTTGAINDIVTQELEGDNADAFIINNMPQREEEEPLECPRCSASFGIARHAELLNHINACLE